MGKKRLLIVDDDPMMHKLYPRFLGDGYEYLHAANGADALMMAMDQLPDLVILDVAMPLLDGRTVCTKLKEHPKTRGIKIVIVSAKDEGFDRAVGLEVGADDYIGKSQIFLSLPESIRRLLD